MSLNFHMEQVKRKIPNFIAKFQSDLDDEMNNWATHMYTFLMYAKKQELLTSIRQKMLLRDLLPQPYCQFTTSLAKTTRRLYFLLCMPFTKATKFVLYLQGVYTRCLQHALYTSNKFVKVIVIQRVPISYAIYLVETLSFSEKRNEARTKFLDHPNPRE